MNELIPNEMRRFISVAVLLTTLLINSTSLNAQDIGIGQWRDHLPYNQVISLAEAGDRVYAATPYALFYLDRNDNSLNRYTKINGLSDVGIRSIRLHKQSNTLVIAYTNGNIDLLKDSKVNNLSDIKRNTLLVNKTINSVNIIHNRAYFSCGFGVVVLDLNKMQFPEPIYYIGAGGTPSQVFDVAFNESDSLLYAATETGVYHANYYKANLANFAEWTKEVGVALPGGSFNHVAAFNNKIIVNKSGQGYADEYMYAKVNGVWQTLEPHNSSDRFNIEVHQNRLIVCNNLSVDVFKPDLTLDYKVWTYNPGDVLPKDAVLTENNVLWIGDEIEGLVKVTNIWTSQKFKLNGPEFPDAFALASAKNDVWMVSGGRSPSFEPLYRYAKFAGFVEGKWTTIDRKKDEFLSDYRDAYAVAVNPANPKQVFIGTMGSGLLEYYDAQFVQRYTTENSTLQDHAQAPGRIDVTGLKFDNENNLWVVNSSAPLLLSRRTPAGVWTSYSLGSAGAGFEADRIAIDNINQKWILGRNLNLFVFNDNNTPDNPNDDRFKRLSSSPGNGNIPGSFVKSIAVDRKGLVWLGTDKGVAVFYSPENVFSNSNFDAQKVLIEQDGYGQYLLETESVTAIAVDGSNRKWFGTDRAGLFLMSEDGTKQVKHFTEINSPLLSNTITDLVLTESGELFIATPRGIISYRSDAVPPPEIFTDISVFPNPVEKNFTGNIAIRGLFENSNVKITDVAGNLVYSINAEGGQVLWNGRNFDGTKVKTGVYIVFISNQDGSKTHVTKILVLN